MKTTANNDDFEPRRHWSRLVTAAEPDGLHLRVQPRVRGHGFHHCGGNTTASGQGAGDEVNNNNNNDNHNRKKAIKLTIKIILAITK